MPRAIRRARERVAAGVGGRSSIFQNQHERKSGERPHTGDLAQNGGRSILQITEKLNALVTGANLASELSDRLQNWPQGGNQRLGNTLLDLVVKSRRRATRESGAEGLYGALHMIHQQSSSSYESISRTYEGQVGLSRGSAVRSGLGDWNLGFIDLHQLPFELWNGCPTAFKTRVPRSVVVAKHP